LAKPDFRGTAARRLSEERELSPAVLSLLSPEGAARRGQVRQIPVERVEANPDQPRLAFDEATLEELAASIREHGVLQPILVRPLPDGRYQLIAGERRLRASRIAGADTIPALVEQIDDETALEIALIENLQREDLSPLDEATMYDRMTRERGYSVRRLAQKLGKDKGYIENRLRLADAPEDVKRLVSLRKDTVSHAYELLKVEDPRKRRRLADQVARGELSLAKLRDRIDGRVIDEDAPRRRRPEPDPQPEAVAAPEPEPEEEPAPVAVGERSLMDAKAQLNEALDELVGVLRAPEVLGGIAEIDRANLAKYLTIAKLKLENAIVLVRSGRPRD
jgi:ParB family transcriptional regulator, chromosome partitioning protein